MCGLCDDGNRTSEGQNRPERLLPCGRIRCIEELVQCGAPLIQDWLAVSTDIGVEGVRYHIHAYRSGFRVRHIRLWPSIPGNKLRHSSRVERCPKGSCGVQRCKCPTRHPAYLIQDKSLQY